MAVGLSITTPSVAPIPLLAIALLGAAFGPGARLAPFLALFSVFVVGLRGLFPAAHLFFQSEGETLASHLGVLLTAAALALIWMAPRFVCRTGAQLSIGVAAVMLLTLLPPFWILGGLGHPVVAMGYLWNGGGWVAIATIGVALCVLAGRLFTWRLAWQLSVLASVVAGGGLVPVEELQLKGNELYRATSTDWGSPADTDSNEMSDRLTKIGRLVTGLGELGVRWIVLPESTISRWSPALDYIVQQEVVAAARKRGLLVWMGVNRTEPDGSRWVGVLEVKPDGTTTMHSARQPMPLSVWQPWRPDAVGTNWFATGMVPAPIGTVYLSLCFEDLIPGLLLWDIARDGRPIAIVSMANNWYLPPYQRELQLRHIEGMAKLFGLPLMRAVNLPREP